MDDLSRRCPDCDVLLDQLTLRTESYADQLQVVSDERRSGILGKLGQHEKETAVPYVCPECGLVRLYVDPDS
ncbi:hypothetical protein [Halocatena halophila]|uniref:hypothetical protein n=1 Tax=Halocatena halophila TaxID=2814576 RepID=UPI002ED21453